MDYSSMSPAEVRALIREGKITGPTAGMCAGYAQANLVILPKDLAYDFLLFTQRNPNPVRCWKSVMWVEKVCPILARMWTSTKTFQNTGSMKMEN